MDESDSKTSEGAAVMVLASGLENRGTPENRGRGSIPPPSATL